MENDLYYLAYALGYVCSILIGWFTINPFIRYLAGRYFPTEHWDRFLPRIVGALEQTIYITAALVGAAEVIAALLLLKLAGDWSQSDREKSYPMYNIFIIGNTLSLILSVGSAYIMSRIFPALP